MIDLHTHSKFSDGSLTPTELVEEAVRAGLTAVALTDHDTLEGLPEFLRAAEGTGVRAVTGVEISAAWDPGTMHILGYGFDPSDAPLEAALQQIRVGRADRNREIVARLQTLGCPISMEALAAQAGEGVAGRPHIAQVMIQAGFVPNKSAAFDRYLAKGSPAYMPRFRLSPEEGIRRIREAGGVAVLAHPMSLGMGAAKLREALREWKAMGLGGVEVYYPEHNAYRTRLYHRLATELGLAVTGGSDFHGALSPAIQLGRGFGSLRVPDELLVPLFKNRCGAGSQESEFRSQHERSGENI